MSIRHLATQGMDASQVAVLSSLLRLLRRSLDSEWRVNDGERQPDAILTDLDTSEGRLAWSSISSCQTPRIAATSSLEVAAQWLVVKPWHRSGENGLVEVLNRIATCSYETEIQQDSDNRGTEPPDTALPQPPAMQRQEPSAPATPVTLAAALEYVRSNGIVVLLTIADLPPLYIDGPRNLFSCRLPVSGLLHELWKRRDLHCEVREIRHQLSNINGWKPLLQLEWLLRLTSRTPDSYAGDVVLTRWPEFIRYPGEAIHLRMASLLLRRPISVQTLATGAGGSLQDAAAFVHACDLLQLIHQLEAVTPPVLVSQEAPPAEAPEPSETAGKAGFLRKVIYTLLKRTA